MNDTGKTHVLIVEDEPLIAMDIERRLLRLGYGVVAIADSAETALEAIHQSRPDLVLMDIQLYGDRNGIQVAAQVQEQFGLPVVYLTAHADLATLEQAKATRPFGYIIKPFENHDLSTAIEIALSRHQAETAIQISLAREKELNELKSRFVSMVSHEFRNPLNLVQFALELLKDPKQQLSPAKKQLYIQRAEDCTKQMKALLEDVLIVEEAEAKQLLCQPTPLDIYQFCQNLAEELQPQDGTESQILLALRSSADLEVLIYPLDERLLRHILTNLLSNAVKYSLNRGTVLFDLLCERESVTFQIQDQGIGISAASQDNLFTPFHRGENARKIPGTGLGLSIVKQAVDAHGGSIRVESEVDRGTTFTVTIKSQNNGEAAFETAYLPSREAPATDPCNSSALLSKDDGE